MPDSTLAMYIHWPFCKSKCPYCDFNSHVKEGLDFARWKAAYLRELEHFADTIRGRTISSIFFGGGTPSLMPPDIAAAIIDRLASYASFADDIEITLEGNPTSVEAQKFKGFRAAGVNRVSLGVQSLDAAQLKFLGREHSANEALEAVATAAELFPNYTFDLIYALPDQTLAGWEKQLTQALKYIGGHMSLYQLTIEKGTRFYSDYQAGKFQLPDEDLAADFFNLTNSIMDAHGLPWYEISNHAAPGKFSRHNMTYWQYGEYLGIGAGAHSRVMGEGGRAALMMIHSPEGWLASVEVHGHGLQHTMPLTGREVMEEMVMMGLRTTRGIDRAQFRELVGADVTEKLQRLDVFTGEGLIALEPEVLRITDKGRMLANRVALEVLG